MQYIEIMTMDRAGNYSLPVTIRVFGIAHFNPHEFHGPDEPVKHTTIVHMMTGLSYVLDIPYNDFKTLISGVVTVGTMSDLHVFSHPVGERTHG